MVFVSTLVLVAHCNVAPYDEEDAYYAAVAGLETDGVEPQGVFDEETEPMVTFSQETEPGKCSHVSVLE